MSMEWNGHASAGQHSRYINIRYFFIKDQIGSGEINLIHCPSGGIMVAYFSPSHYKDTFSKKSTTLFWASHISLPTQRPHQTGQPRSVLDPSLPKKWFQLTMCNSLKINEWRVICDQPTSNIPRTSNRHFCVGTVTLVAPEQVIMISYLARLKCY